MLFSIRNTSEKFKAERGWQQGQQFLTRRNNKRVEFWTHKTQCDVRKHMSPYSTYLLTEAKTNFRYCQAQYATTKCFFHNNHSVVLFFHSNKEKYLLILFSSFIKTFLWLLDLAPKLLRQIHFPSFWWKHTSVWIKAYFMHWILRLAIFHFIRQSLSVVGFVNEPVNPLNFILNGLQPRCERLTTDLFWCYIGAYI